MQDKEILRNIYLVTKALDPTRPIIDTSGFCHVVTDIYDLHDYEQEPAVFQKRYGDMQPGDDCYDEKEYCQRYDGNTPLFMSEYGGTFWSSDASVMEALKPEGGWLRWEKPKNENEVCRRIVGLSEALLKSKAFCGFCYTQLTDVEQNSMGSILMKERKNFQIKSMKRFVTQIWRLRVWSMIKSVSRATAARPLPRTTIASFPTSPR